MAQTDNRKLDAGDPFPPFTLSIVGGEELRIPEELTADYTVLLGYRGKW